MRHAASGLKSIALVMNGMVTAHAILCDGAEIVNICGVPDLHFRTRTRWTISPTSVYNGVAFH